MQLDIAEQVSLCCNPHGLSGHLKNKTSCKDVRFILTENSHREREIEIEKETYKISLTIHFSVWSDMYRERVIIFFSSSLVSSFSIYNQMAFSSEGLLKFPLSCEKAICPWEGSLTQNKVGYVLMEVCLHFYWWTLEGKLNGKFLFGLS